MPRVANAQLSRMSNKQKKTELNKDKLSNGARSGNASWDVQCFRQEPQKALLSRTVHTTATSTALKQGWCGIAPLLPIVWVELFFVSKSCFFIISYQGVEQGAVDWNLSTAGHIDFSFAPCELPWPWPEFRTSWYKKGYRLYRQSLIEFVHRGQLRKTHKQYVLGLLTQQSMTCFITTQSIVLQPILSYSTFHTAVMLISHTQDKIIFMDLTCNSHNHI